MPAKKVTGPKIRTERTIFIQNRIDLNIKNIAYHNQLHTQPHHISHQTN